MATNRTPKKAVTQLGDWKPVFLKHLAETGNVGASAKHANVARHTAYDHKYDDKDFAEKWKQALREAGDVLEAEAWRRGVKGVSKPVFHAGKVVGEVQEYSDTLLIFLLKGTRPKKFRENVRHEVTGKNGGVIKSHTTIDLSGFSDEELIKLERAALGGAGGINPPGRN